MIGTLPVADLAPLEYRYALDAALALIGGRAAPVVRCNVAALDAELRQRMPWWTDRPGAGAALWVEPQVHTWRAELRALAQALPKGGRLMVIAARPLARLLPERRPWADQPLGITAGGIGRLRRGLAAAGFALETSYGVHTAPAIGLSALSALAARLGLPDIGDRLHVAARLRYASAGPLAPLATVALLVCGKQHI